ncbi:class II aldolase/adducin family protein [Sphaerobacter sp.]|uniref:class II aldolase/adducin family protein n=1 Tax=Sphaerobacter sp. TaxID=2099654 RepID=UPI001E0A1F3E|nr:class II aldolase/adducin family protein [Sphaerobacter sp.]MBX5445756.1 class II aldolase/adducin family protein [Sphaerobacter sp.]
MTVETGYAILDANQAAAQDFSLIGELRTETQRWFAEGLKRELLRRGHTYHEKPVPDIRLVLNVVDPDNPQPYRRKAQATFVTAIVDLDYYPEDFIRTGYPYLVRALSNLGILLARGENGLEAHFLTMEQGHYVVTYTPGEDDEFFARIYDRIQPLASSQLVINNVFKTDLEEELWNGDEITQQLTRAGQKLDAMNLLPAPFPIHEILGPRDLRHVMRLYGIGGLSYGNLSARKDEKRFWMSASGVDKSKLEVIGRDILLVSDFDPKTPAMILSVPPNVQPRRVSVDAIEHWMIYREHPEVGAIVHVHAWMDGIRSTEINYPCGTIQLATAVAELVRQEPDPSRAVIGLKNHGVTITGHSLDEIFERIEGKIIPQVPMS